VVEKRREQVLTNNLLPTDMVLKLFLILFLVFKRLEMHIREKSEAPTNLKFRTSLIRKHVYGPVLGIRSIINV